MKPLSPSKKVNCQIGSWMLVLHLRKLCPRPKSHLPRPKWQKPHQRMKPLSPSKKANCQIGSWKLVLLLKKLCPRPKSHLLRPKWQKPHQQMKANCRIGSRQALPQRLALLWQALSQLSPAKANRPQPSSLPQNPKRLQNLNPPASSLKLK
jgi:hypothetical protein